MIFDTHAHYDDHAFDGDREEVLACLQDRGVSYVVDVGSTVLSLPRVKDLADRYAFVYGALGLHPDDVGVHAREAGEVFELPHFQYDGKMQPPLTGLVSGLTPAVKEWIRGALADPKIVAVGEIGLDYHWNIESREVQIRCFKEQIGLAIEADLPILVHSRTAAEDTMDVIQEMYGAGSPARKAARQEALKKLRPEQYTEVPGKEWVWKKEVPEGPGRHLLRKGIIHAYAYSVEQAKIYTELGFYLGIGGVLTYQNSKKLKKVVREIPLTSLVLETDCPYLTPEPLKGQRNDSASLIFVAEKIAEIKGLPVQEVLRVTYENACHLFKLRGCQPRGRSFNS